MRRKSALRRVLVPAALAIGLLSVGVSAAHALVEIPYGGFALPSGGQYQAPGGGGTNITGNIAGYTGAGSVSVCQRTWDATNGAWREGCGINGAGNALNLMPYLGHSLYPNIKNNSPWTHTIQGWYYTQ